MIIGRFEETVTRLICPLSRQNVAKNRDTKELTAENQTVSSFKVPRAGLEPARPFRAKGFSCHYGFRHRLRLPRVVCGPDYSFTMEPGSLGVSCLVSAPSSFQRLGSRLPSALPVKASLNLRHSTSLLSERALIRALPR